MTEIFIYLAIGLVAGAVGGMVGVGGGIVVIPALVMFMGFTQKSAQGTSLAFLLPPVSILAVLNYYRTGNVDIKASAIMACTFLIGSYFSSKLAVNMDDQILKKIFAVFLVIYAAKLYFGK